MENNIVKPGNYINDEQKKLLIDFMEKHPELQAGKFNKEFTYKKAKILWEEISAMLNEIPGVIKTWDKWRKSWQDIKNMAKVKGSTIKNHTRSTGCGPSALQDLNEVERSLLAMIGPTVVEGIALTAESVVTFNWNNGTEHDLINEQAVDDILESPLYNEVEPMPAEAQPRATKRKRSRYERVMHESEKLAVISERDCDNRQAYYRNKISLYEYHLPLKKRDVEAKENIVKLLLTLIEKPE